MATAIYDDPGSIYGTATYGAGPAPVVSPVTPVVAAPQPTVPLSPSLQVRIPFGVDSTGGIAFSSDIVETDRMNLITLVGTQPGERAMRPDYGVGTRALLFENDDLLLGQTITSEILDAATRYAPEVTVLDVEMERDPNNEGQTNVHVSYRPAATRLDTSEDTISTTVADGG